MIAPEICVVGSINMDLVVETNRFPQPGETVIGGAFQMFPGGKGANQAVAAARLGAPVSMIGCIGRDANGETVRAALNADGVDTDAVAEHATAATGVGVITVTPDGENTIVVASGANATLTAADVEKNRVMIGNADAMILQLEISIDAVMKAVEIARETETVVILNAAPAPSPPSSLPLPEKLLHHVDVLIVNEIEATTLARTGANADPDTILKALHALGPRLMVLTLGARGAMSFDGKLIERQDAFPVEVVDTTAAGDAFVGAFAYQHVLGAGVAHALKFACAAGALATIMRGALPSLPNDAEVIDFLYACEV